MSRARHWKDRSDSTQSRCPAKGRSWKSRLALRDAAPPNWCASALRDYSPIRAQRALREYWMMVRVVWREYSRMFGASLRIAPQLQIVDSLSMATSSLRKPPPSRVRASSSQQVKYLTSSLHHRSMFVLAAQSRPSSCSLQGGCLTDCL